MGNPHSGSKLWEALDREIGESRKDREQIIAHGKLQPPAAFHHREDRCDLRSRLRASHVYPVFSTDGDRPHGVLRQVITQLQFGIFQEARELVPQGERVVAGLG